VILAIESGATSAERLVTLAELVRGEAQPTADAPRLFKSTGMSWEDAVVASALADRS
jgi:ornithine cyclodeaminase